LRSNLNIFVCVAWAWVIVVGGQNVSKGQTSTIYWRN